MNLGRIQFNHYNFLPRNWWSGQYGALVSMILEAFFPLLQNIFGDLNSENGWPHIVTKSLLYTLPQENQNSLKKQLLI